MTMFTRNDKNPDAPADSSGDQNTNASSSAAQTPARNQAVAQPMTSPAQSNPRTSASYASPPQPQMVSVISKALKITGQLESTEDIQIDGEIDGDIRGLSVKVGSNAKVKGTVYGDAVELAGTVNGKIEAKSVVLTSTAHMSGDVVHQEIRIESGAFIDGHCKPDYGTAQTKSGNGAALKSGAASNPSEKSQSANAKA